MVICIADFTISVSFRQMDKGRGQRDCAWQCSLCLVSLGSAPSAWCPIFHNASLYPVSQGMVTQISTILELRLGIVSLYMADVSVAYHIHFYSTKKLTQS